MFTGIVTQDTWHLDDQTSSFTINNIKQVGKSYVNKNNKIYFAKITIPKINGYKAYIVPNKSNPALFTVSFIAVPTKNKPSTPVEETPSKPSAPINPTSNSVWSNLDHKVVNTLNQSDSGRTMPADNSTYRVNTPVSNATIDLSNSVITQPVHAQTRTRIRVNKHFKLRKHGKKHVIKHLKHRKKVTKHGKKHVIKHFKHRKKVASQFKKHRL